MRVVVFGDANDNVHHIRHAAAAFRAAIELAINLGRDHQLPGIGAQEIQDNVLDFLAGDHVALTNKHGAPMETAGWKMAA